MGTAQSRLRRAPRHIGAFLWIICSAASAPAGDLVRHELHVPGAVQRVLAEDVDGDGKRELLVFSTTGGDQPQRRVSLYGWSGGMLDTSPRTTWLLEPDAGLFDLGRDPQDGPSLWYCTPSAVRRYRLRDALTRAPQAETWLEAPNLLGGRTYEWVLFHDFARDWHGDGADTPAVFQPGRVLLTRRDPAAPADVIELNSEIELTALPVSYDLLPPLPLFVTHRLPVLERVDANGDGRADIIAALGDRVAIYPAAADGRIAPRAQRVEHLPSIARAGDETTRQAIQFADVTGDGRADAVLTTITGGISNLRQTTDIFPGSGDGFATVPSASLSTQGAAGLSLLTDFDGDGRPELTAATVTIGVAAVLRFLLTRRLNIEYATYAIDAQGRLAPQPMLAWTQPARFDLEGPGDPSVITLAGDFDGDGVRDVAAARGDDTIAIRGVVRTDNGLSLGTVIADVHAPGRGQALASDLDGDGRSDLVVYSPKQADGGVAVFLTPPPG